MPFLRLLFKYCGERALNGGRTEGWSGFQVTAADSAVGVTFSDGTAFNISRNARMGLNEFVYDPKRKSNSTLISLSKGTFTFVAGQVAKTGDMKIDT
jgi:hypothetical protein